MENKNHFWISNSRQENQKSDYEMGLNPLLTNYFIIIIEIVNFRYMEKEFNQKEYIKEYQRENYKQFKTKLKPDEMEEVNQFLKDNNMNKRELIMFGMSLLKRKGMMKMLKVEKIENLIKDIRENAIENYLSKWDENNSMSKADWELGSKGSIKGYNGENIEYISYNEFNDLYSNLTYNLNDVNEKVLDKIIEYLEKEQKKVEINDLDRECYSVSDFE